MSKKWIEGNTKLFLRLRDGCQIDVQLPKLAVDAATTTDSALLTGLKKCLHIPGSFPLGFTVQT